MGVSTTLITDGWQGARRVASNEGTAALLLRIVDVGLAGIIGVAPYLFGGRHDFGRLVLLSLIAVTATAWFARQALRPSAPWTKTAAHGILLAGAGLLLVQLLPLPDAWVAALTPRTRDLLPWWSSGAVAGLGAWNRLSLTPHETTKSLAMFAGYGLLFLVVIGRVDDARDARRLLRLIAVSSVLMATFGLLQFFTSDGRFFWFYEHPYRTTRLHPCGSFINRNHFAHFLVLGIGPLVAWLFELSAAPAAASRQDAGFARRERVVRWLLVGALLLLVCTVLRTLSRGGALALLTAAGTLVAIGWWRRLVDSRCLYGLVAFTAGVAGLLSLDGYDQVAERLDFTQGSLSAMDEHGARRRIWAANAAAIEAGWLTGSGAGSHAEIYRVYLPESLPMEYTHAESGYLQMITENGVFGGMLLLAGIGLCGGWCWNCLRYARATSATVWFAACAAGLAASFVHAAIDFVWYIPACMSVTVILAGCLLRLSQLARSSNGRPAGRITWPQSRWLELAVAAVLVAGWMVTTYVGPGCAAIYWDGYLRTSFASRASAERQLSNLITRADPSSVGSPEPFAAAMLQQLRRVVAWDPRFARAQARLAAAYVAQFESLQAAGTNVMTVGQIQDAALASNFGSPGELRAWLCRAFGESAALLYRAESAARRAIELGPLQGEAYVLLGELCFLRGESQRERDACFAQALCVRPHDADVLYEVGEQKFLSGAWDESLRMWQECFASRGPHQAKIVYLQAARIPAAMFVEIYRPDWGTLPQVWARYRAFGAAGDLHELVAYAAEAAAREAPRSAGSRPVHIWYSLASMYAELGRSDQSLACLQRAYGIDPRDFGVRFALANALLASGRYDEAETHVRWCLGRRPQQKHLTAALVTIAKARTAAPKGPHSRVQPASHLRAFDDSNQVARSYPGAEARPVQPPDEDRELARHSVTASPTRD